MAVAAGLMVMGAAIVLAIFGPSRITSYTGSANNPSTAGRVTIRPPENRLPLEQIELTTLDGTTLSVAEMKGRVLLVNLWATWCGPCVEEMPALNALESKLGGERFHVVAAALDRGGAKVAKDWYDKNGITSLAVYAADLRQFPMALLPTSILIDAQGRVAWRGQGAQPWDSDKLRAEVEKLINEPRG